MDYIPDIERARIVLQNCSKKIAQRIRGKPLNPKEYSLQLGFGIATDWLGWAGSIDGISHSILRRRKSERSETLLELTRFMFLWTAANALFSRQDILSLFSVAQPKSELERFKMLYRQTAQTRVEQDNSLKILHNILKQPMEVTSFPWVPIKSPPTILEVIYQKYMQPPEQKRAIGKMMLSSIQNSAYGQLDLPTLIYATRNWNVHGVLLSSSFRGTGKKFLLWVKTVGCELTRALEGSGQFVLSKI